ncbi:MAG: peptidase M28, partial [Arenibacter sp.]|nr:peptidase M28 [Arenibacter sp.]
DKRQITIKLSPQRPTNRLDIFTNDVKVLNASINNIELSPYFLENRPSTKLVSHFVSNNDSTLLECTISKGDELVLSIYESSNDLLENPLFSVPDRPEDNLPMPFVLNDAIIVTKKIKF